MPAIRSAALRGFRSTVHRLGGDPDAIAVRAGLAPEALDRDDVPVDDLAVARALEVAARALACPDLGLRIAARQGPATLGPLVLAIRNAPSAAAAVRCASRYVFLQSRTMSVALAEDGDGDPDVLALRFEVAAGQAVSAQGLDLGLGLAHRAVETLAGADYGLVSVDLPHRPLAPIARYEDFFGAPVRVRRPAALLRVPRELTTEALNGADEALLRPALTFLSAPTDAVADDGVVGRVRTALRRSLGAGSSEISVVARALLVHPRTLQRHLAAERTSFALILDDVRRDAAYRYLTTTDLPIQQIAALVGLARQSALTRCARRWWNATPSRLREIHRDVVQG
ncbi:AraC family transcriptional regulator [Nocardia bovistercoris]|uniref:AraC family transcriptional regulator n=1 Tax=Nocardia bovistercoris TaxID=2785916 RepID=A0A931IB89_9NOCA|nr:AraC family transcriptional regulator [Nocardia bovistercoris]MBH0778407.1 AraC family transcriptional regulator [Nocardia bovistercoris]